MREEDQKVQSYVPGRVSEKERRQREKHNKYIARVWVKENEEVTDLFVLPRPAKSLQNGAGSISKLEHTRSDR